MTHARQVRLRFLVAFTVCPLLLLSAGSTAWANLLVYDGFDYTVGSFLVDSTENAPIQNGGIGWAGPWDDTAGAPPAGQFHFSSIIQANSMQYTDGLGNSLATVGGKLLASGVTGTSQPGRTLAARRASPATGETVTTWISFLGKRVGDVNAQDPPNQFDGTYRRGANLALFDLGGGASQPEKLNFGESSNYQYPKPGGGFEDRWQARHAGVPATVLTNQPFAPNPTGTPTGTETTAQMRDAFSSTLFTQESLAVIRIDHVAGDANAAITGGINGGKNGGNDNIFIWMNPNLNSTPSEASAAIKFVSDELVAAANALAAPPAPFLGSADPGSGSGGEINFDRLRLFAGNIAGTPPAHTPPAQWLFDEFRIGTSFADVAPIAAAPGVNGDFNNDTKVDAVDYTIWRNNLDALTDDAINNNGDDIPGINNGDYAVWKTNFGTGGGAGSAASSSVPEPTSWLFAVLGLATLPALRRRKI